ncbi:MAG: 4-aminobutyrate--2-oxoglutarate transaminase [Elusimicrobiota bacterium]
MKTLTKPIAKKENMSLNSAHWKDRERYVTGSFYHYTRIFIKEASGAVMWDVDGKRYLDFTGGIGALNVGHCHPRVVEAIRRQAGEFLHTCFPAIAYENYVRVCQKLCEAVPGNFPKKAMLVNSGAEAVENAVKFAKSYTKRSAVISFGQAFHGRTLLAFTLTGKENPYRLGLGPYAADVYHAYYPYSYRPPVGVASRDVCAYALGRLEEMFHTQVDPSRVAAILVEPVQGEGGFVVPPTDFLPALRKICDQHGIVLIVDEVQTGFGRTGKMFAHEHAGITSDLVTVAKSIAAGLPLAGVVGRAQIMDAAEEGGVGSTYGGNPVACAASLAVFEIFEQERLLERARKIGLTIETRFKSWAKQMPMVGEARGLGAMQAVELVADRSTKEPMPLKTMKAILGDCSKKGLMILKAGAYGNVIRTLVPLVATDEEITEGLDILESVLKEL